MGKFTPLRPLNVLRGSHGPGFARYAVRFRDTRLTTLWKRLRPIVQWGGLALVLVFVGLYLSRQWDSIREVSLTIHWPLLIASQLVLTFGLGLLPLGNWTTLDDLGARLPPVTVWHIFYLSNMAKYLPGSIWALPSRAIFYNRQGVSKTKSGAALVWEVLLMVVSAALVSLLALRLLIRYVSVEVFVAALVGLLVVALLFALPSVRRFARRRLLRFEATLSLGGVVRTLGAYIVSWVVMGIAFAGMVASIAPAFDWAATPELIGLFTGSWLVGFLAIFAPGGIGVRDLLLALGLSAYLQDPLPTVIAVFARVMWTIAELLGLGIVSLWRLVSQRRRQSQGAVL